MNLKMYLPFYKRNLAVAVPVILSQLGQVVVQFADSMMVGRLGATQLASVSFAGAIFMVGMMFIMGTSMGLTPLVGQSAARGEHRKCANLFQNSFVMNLLLGGLIILIMFGGSFYMHLMGQDSEVVAYGVPYFRIMLVSLIPMLVFFSFKQFMEGIGNTRVAMIRTMVTNVINIALNYVLIYGKFGFPERGVLGAAYATLIARILMPLAFIAVFLKRNSLKRYLLFFNKASFSFSSVKNLFNVGMPIGGQILVEQIAFGFTTIMAGWLGAITLASHQIAMNISTMVFMILCGLSAGTTIRVSHQYGLGKIEDMQKAAVASYHLTIFSVAICDILILLFRSQIPLLFTNDQEVIKMAADLMIILSIYLLPDGLQNVALGALRGIADVKAPMIYAVISYLLLNIPIGYFCGFILGYGVMGVWVGFIAGLTAASVLFMLRFRKKAKIYELEQSQKSELALAA